MKLGLVTPWFGREVKGGAEQQAWEIASRLARRGHQLTVFTTCCRSHQDDWSTNHLQVGSTVEPEGFTIRRFPVVTRNKAAFDEVAAKLLALSPIPLKRGLSPVSEADGAIFVHELIRAPELIEFLKTDRDYERFILLPYLYTPVIEGTLVLGERAALQPCLHNEPYAFLPEVAEAFYQAGNLLFNSAGEMELATRLFGPAIVTKSHLVGEGIELSGTSKREAMRENVASVIDGTSYLLYLGRKDKGKNVDLLVRAFAGFRSIRPNTKLRLVLAGHGSLHDELPTGAVDLGLVSDTEKIALLRHCTALLQPSENESFSRAIMEAWLEGRPVAANGNCLATAVAVREAKGGWAVTGAEQSWTELLVQISRLTPNELDELGANGRSYARKTCDWDSVLDRYEAALPLPPRRDSTTSVFGDRFAGVRVNQFLPNLADGDAVSNHARAIREALRQFGFCSDIFASWIDPRIANEGLPFTPSALEDSDALVYHHSVGTDLVSQLVNFTGPKCLIYHNVTPPDFFTPYRPAFARVLKEGREQLRQIASGFDIAAAVSAYNSRDLIAAGFSNPVFLPISTDPSEWSFSPDPAVMEAMQDGRTNLLFVGRIAPNKGQDELVRAFQHFLALDRNARLILVGRFEKDDPYAAELQDAIHHRGLRGLVNLAGDVSKAALAAYYRTAHLFWSMSEHEGFGVPFVEAMWHDVPILAFRSSAVPETLGAAAMMFNSKRDLSEVAALAHLITNDAELRVKIVAAQRKERLRFLPERTALLLGRIVRALLTSTDARIPETLANSALRTASGPEISAESRVATARLLRR